MSDAPIQATLSPAEWKLVQELRTLPDSPLKDQGVGIEGFPCGTPQSSCEDCHRIWSTLELISERAKQRPEGQGCC